MLWVFVASVALAGTLEWPIDLDGDGKKEAIVYSGGDVEPDSDEPPDEETLTLGKTTLSYSPMFPITVVPLDLKHGDGVVEVMTCHAGPRDDSECGLSRYVNQELVSIETPSVPPTVSMFTATGSGIVLAHSNENRLFTRIDKLILKKDGRLSFVPQPYYRVGKTIKIDRMCPVTLTPGGGAVVANVRPGSEIKVLVSDGTDNFLVELSSGLTGWVTMSTLTQASDYIMMMMSAG